MNSKKVELLKAHYEAFNRGDMVEAARDFSDEIIYKDQARGLRLVGREQVKAGLSEWKDSFSDGRHTDIKHTALGDWVVTRSVGTGTNDGPLGPLAPTGRMVTFPICELWEFDGDGRIAGGEIFYDQLTILTQLGHIPATETAGA